MTVTTIGSSTLVILACLTLACLSPDQGGAQHLGASDTDPASHTLPADNSSDDRHPAICLPVPHQSRSIDHLRLYPATHVAAGLDACGLREVVTTDETGAEVALWTHRDDGTWLAIELAHANSVSRVESRREDGNWVEQQVRGFAGNESILQAFDSEGRLVAMHRTSYYSGSRYSDIKTSQRWEDDRLTSRVRQYLPTPYMPEAKTETWDYDYDAAGRMTRASYSYGDERFPLSILLEARLAYDEIDRPVERTLLFRGSPTSIETWRWGDARLLQRTIEVYPVDPELEKVGGNGAWAVYGPEQRRALERALYEIPAADAEAEAKPCDRSPWSWFMTSTGLEYSAGWTHQEPQGTLLSPPPQPKRAGHVGASSYYDGPAVGRSYDVFGSPEIRTVGIRSGYGIRIARMLGIPDGPAAGRLHRLQLRYDEDGRLMSETLVGASQDGADAHTLFERTRMLSDGRLRSDSLQLHPVDAPADERTLHFEWDADGRLLSRTLSGQGRVIDTTAWAYDDRGRIVELTTQSSVVDLGYDGSGRLAEETLTPAPEAEEPAKRNTYTYDSEGRLVEHLGTVGNRSVLERIEFDPSGREVFRGTDGDGDGVFEEAITSEYRHDDRLARRRVVGLHETRHEPEPFVELETYAYDCDP